MATNYLIDNNVLIPTAVAGAFIAVNTYEAKCGISINGNNGFYVTAWVEKNGQVMDSDLGTAAYIVKDAALNDSLILLESGVTADASGYFAFAPKLASELIDLTHFIIELSIYADGNLIVTSWPFNLGE